MGTLGKKLFAGRFEIEEEAGAGGAGTVYRARDTGTGERVALKVLRAPRTTATERFSREAQTLAMLRHPAVVRYIAHGVSEDGESFLAMEWLEGRDLRRHLAEQGLTVAETVALGARAADALAAVHALGVMHRDVKPSNLFLVGGDVADVRLIDFGLVRLDDVGNSLTRSGVAVGTPGYMAPEQARGDREASTRADLFALGCVLFRCLTGRPPFEGAHPVALLTKVLLEAPPRARSLRPEVPEALDALVARLLEKDPARRPAGAAEVAEALRSIEIGALQGGRAEVAPGAVLVSGLGDGERRIAAVLLVAASPQTEERTAGARDLAALVDRFGCHLERLSDGAAVITAGRPPLSVDEVARVARCALATGALLPGVPLALATGWTETAGQGLVGEAIARAAALLARHSEEASPSAVLVDDLTAALLDPHFEVEGSRMTGLRDPAMPARTRFGEATPCLGREWELSTVEAQLLECIEERRAVALVFTGAAGVGKSRLAAEALAALRRTPPVTPPPVHTSRIPAGVTVWIARGDATRSGSAPGVVEMVLRASWEAHGGEAAPPDAQLAFEQTRRAFVDALAAECAAHPVVLVLDDLHRADPVSIRLLDAALSTLEQAPLMVLAFARPEIDERFPRLWAGRNVQRLRLKPLPRKPTERLARIALGPDADSGAVGRVLDLAEGNVFFLEELIRAGAAGGPGAPAPRPLPATVLGMVQARLGALDPGVRRALRAASLYGEAFWPSAVTALLGGTPTPAEGWVDALVASELWTRRPSSRFAGEPELAFRNALVREAAYAMLTDGDRAAGHLLAGAWLERSGEREAAVLARHFELGGDALRAALHRARAAEQLLEDAPLPALDPPPLD